ncbi:hypothetical protein H0H81_012450, partial [Sphagnurus paluster]
MMEHLRQLAETAGTAIISTGPDEDPDEEHRDELDEPDDDEIDMEAEGGGTEADLEHDVGAED